MIWAEFKPCFCSRQFFCIMIIFVYFPESDKNRKELIQYHQTCIRKFCWRYTALGFLIVGQFSQSNKQLLSSMLDLKKKKTFIFPPIKVIVYWIVFSPIWPIITKPCNHSAHSKTQTTWLFYGKLQLILWPPPPKKKQTRTTTQPLSKESNCSFERRVGTFNYEEICHW